jgi:hypothetical protein
VSVTTHKLTRRPAAELYEQEARLIAKQERLIALLEAMEFSRTRSNTPGADLLWTHRNGGVEVTFVGLDDNSGPNLIVRIHALDQGDGYGRLVVDLAYEVPDSLFVHNVEAALGRRGRRTQLRPPRGERHERVSPVPFGDVQVGDLLGVDGAWYEVWNRRRDLIELRAWTEEDAAITGSRYRQLHATATVSSFSLWRLPQSTDTSSRG